MPKEGKTLFFLRGAWKVRKRERVMGKNLIYNMVPCGGCCLKAKTRLSDRKPGLLYTKSGKTQFRLQFIASNFKDESH